MTRDTLGPRRVVRVGRYAIDDALDVEKTNIFAYRLTRDPKLLVFAEGKSEADAVWFSIGRLKNRFVTEALDVLESPAARFERAFRAACQRIEIPGEEPMAPDEKQLVEWRSGGKVAGDEWVDRVVDRFGRTAVQEMGSVAYDLANLAPGADGPFALPPGVVLTR